jgi:hypothetical protein
MPNETPEPPVASATAPSTPAIVQPSSDQALVTFVDRDHKLLERLQASADYNRRTLAAEILYRLDRTFDEAV